MLWLVLTRLGYAKVSLSQVKASISAGAYRVKSKLCGQVATDMATDLELGSKPSCLSEDHGHLLCFFIHSPEASTKKKQHCHFRVHSSPPQSLLKP